MAEEGRKVACDKCSPAAKANGHLLAERAKEWSSLLAIGAGGFLAFTALSGLAIWLLPFNIPNQVNVILHSLAGLAFLIPCLWYVVRHWLRYWRDPMSHNQLLGYVAGVATLFCLLSGIVLTWQAGAGTRINYGWDTVHIVTTLALLAFGLPHVLLIVSRDRKARQKIAGPEMAGAYAGGVLVLTLAGVAVIFLAAYAYPRVRLSNHFPAGYSYKYGPDRPFAPSMAKTASGQAMDARLLSGSSSCGTAGCHEEIVKEWEVSAHRYSAMDLGFQAIQTTMAKQNGPESTRYCGGCHDPISLFSGTKNLFIETEQLTSLQGYREGVSCLTCHSVRQVDVKGNANFVVAEPVRYMFELEYNQKQSRTNRFLRDFLIRAYPREHVKTLSKTLFKTPEYCAACHKQFIDAEVNNVGWVQLQNQYDNWKQSHWNHAGDARKTIECRECHMPLAASFDPAAGDAKDYNRSPNDGKHRSHRFVAANLMMPALLRLPGWEKQVELTQQWLQGKYEIPEIADKWRTGVVVGLELIAPETIRPGEAVNLKLILTSNKVGHDFPTGPLDIIQAWVEVVAKDDQGRVLYETGTVDPKGFIKPGTFMFKAEPVDQYGNLIDRHNLWEMVGVRYRRSLFPGFSDTAEFSFLCPQLAPVRTKKFPQELAYHVDVPRSSARSIRIEARLCYRKIDQYLLNFIFGEKKGLTAPITVMASKAQVIEIASGAAKSSGR